MSSFILNNGPITDPIPVSSLPVQVEDAESQTHRSCTLIPGTPHALSQRSPTLIPRSSLVHFFTCVTFVAVYVLYHSGPIPNPSYPPDPSHDATSHISYLLISHSFISVPHAGNKPGRKQREFRKQVSARPNCGHLFSESLQEQSAIMTQPGAGDTIL